MRPTRQKDFIYYATHAIDTPVSCRLRREGESKEREEDAGRWEEEKNKYRIEKRELEKK